MLNLDDRSSVTSLDPHGMLDKFENFADQCRQALEIARKVSLPTLDGTPKAVFLTGMGGSAAGGDFCRALFDAEGVCPFLVNRDYHLPPYVGKGHVVFVASYSGNTEETLSAYADATSSGATVIAISSGGKLTELARRDGHTVITVPGGLPPRSALGLMLIPVLYASEALGFLKEQNYEGAFKLLDEGRREWTVESIGSNKAKELARACFGNLPIVYGLGTWQGLVAGRWKGQINENAKNLAFPNSFPELNHNEILGWVGAPNQGVKKFVVIVLEGGTESAKMKARARISQDLAPGTEWHYVQAKGSRLLEKLLTLASLADFTSIYLAALNEVDPENIDSINTLKEELSKVSS